LATGSKERAGLLQKSSRNRGQQDAPQLLQRPRNHAASNAFLQAALTHKRPLRGESNDAESTD
jgi:hypothetical protein